MIFFKKTFSKKTKMKNPNINANVSSLQFPGARNLTIRT